jgi:hypothetical protein
VGRKYDDRYDFICLVWEDLEISIDIDVHPDFGILDCPCFSVSLNHSQNIRRMNSYSRSAAGRYVASELQIRASRRPGAAVNDD